MAPDRELRPEPLYERGGFQVSASPWGPGDHIGRLNWITPESRAEILARTDGTTMIDLSTEYFIGMPGFTVLGWPEYRIWLSATPEGGVVDDRTGFGRDVNSTTPQAVDAICLNTHTGTHIDALNHFGYDGRYWNGWTQANDMGSRHWLKGGVDHYPPIVARAVLLDVAGLHGEPELPDAYEITPDELKSAARAAGVEVRRGDVVLIRTGRMRRWPDQGAYVFGEAGAPGIGLAAARWLCEGAGAMVIGADNIALECLPPREPGQILPVHAYMFATAGAQIVEMADLEELAASGLSEFCAMGFMLRLRGATASPLRLSAIGLR